MKVFLSAKNFDNSFSYCFNVAIDEFYLEEPAEKMCGRDRRRGRRRNRAVMEMVRVGFCIGFTKVVEKAC